MPIARTRAVSPVAAIRRSSVVSGRCRWTVRRKAAGGSSRGSSAPASIVRPSAITRCGRSSVRSSTRRMSAHRPGAIEPTSWRRPMYSAALTVASWMASSGSRPAAIAVRTAWLRCPVASSVSGCMSSVTSSAWRLSTPSSVRTFTHSATSCHALPSRNWTHMPARSLASASSRWTLSWSESTPAHTYAWRRWSLQPWRLQCPVTGRPASRTAPIISWVSASASYTPGMFIISPRAATPSHVSASRMSSGPRCAPASSKPGSAGTQDGTARRTFRGRPRPSSSIQRMPSRPRTLAISWLSMRTVVVPCGRTASANRATVTIADSTWRCVSISPGTR